MGDGQGADGSVAGLMDGIHARTCNGGGVTTGRLSKRATVQIPTTSGGHAIAPHV